MRKKIQISAKNLTKVFVHHSRSTKKGISTDGLAALLYLFKRICKRNKDVSGIKREDNTVFFALSDINFEVQSGEVLGIIGRNGAGKSTLLKILARVLDPSMGQVVMHGKVMSMLELGLGFAPELTVRENIEIQGRLAGLTVKQINAAEHDILQFSGLQDFRNKPLSTCPSGSFTQLCFAAMANFKVDIILADEVLAVGDAKFRSICEERIRKANLLGESVLFVSHDMSAIRRLCTRVIWIDKGKIVADGDTDKVVAAYTTELLTGKLLPLSNVELSTGCRFLDFRLLDAQKSPVGAIQITEDAYIDCLLEITKPNIEVVLQIELWHTKHFVLRMESQRIKTDSNNITFRVAVKIPGNFLNELSYQARCRLLALNATEKNSEAVIVAQNSFDMMIINPRPEESVWANWQWGRPGVISPKLHWHCKQEDQDILL